MGATQVVRTGSVMVMPKVHQVVPVVLTPLPFVVRTQAMTVDAQRCVYEARCTVQVQGEDAAIQRVAERLGERTEDPPRLNEVLEAPVASEIRLLIGHTEASDPGQLAGMLAQRLIPLLAEFGFDLKDLAFGTVSA